LAKKITGEVVVWRLGGADGRQYLGNFTWNPNLEGMGKGVLEPLSLFYAKNAELMNVLDVDGDGRKDTVWKYTPAGQTSYGCVIMFDRGLANRRVVGGMTLSAVGNTPRPAECLGAGDFGDGPRAVVRENSNSHVWFLKNSYAYSPDTGNNPNPPQTKVVSAVVNEIRLNSAGNIVTLQAAYAAPVFVGKLQSGEASIFYETAVNTPSGIPKGATQEIRTSASSNFDLNSLSYAPKDISNTSTGSLYAGLIGNWHTRHGHGMIDITAALRSLGSTVVAANETEFTSSNTGSKRWLEMINATPAHAAGINGNGVVVAVIDDTIDVNHADLSANVIVNTAEVASDNIDNDNNGYIDDYKGIYLYPQLINGTVVVKSNGQVIPANTPAGSHGSAVAGIIAATTSNVGGATVTGVAPSAKILPIRIDVSSKEAITAAINYALSRNAQVINLSLGSMDVLGYAPFGTAMSNAKIKGVAVVIASGNTGGLLGIGDIADLYSNQNFNNVITVGSIKAGISVQGASNAQGYTGSIFSDKPGTTVGRFIAAPGEDVTTLDRYNTLFVNFDGTSAAAPMVSGALALLKQAYPARTGAQNIQTLIDTATLEALSR
jgi:subtilisin